jgi:hypothetical protein
VVVAVGPAGLCGLDGRGLGTALLCCGDGPSCFVAPSPPSRPSLLVPFEDSDTMLNVVFLGSVARLCIACRCPICTRLAGRAATNRRRTSFPRRTPATLGLFNVRRKADASDRAWLRLEATLSLGLGSGATPAVSLAAPVCGKCSGESRSGDSEDCRKKCRSKSFRVSSLFCDSAVSAGAAEVCKVCMGSCPADGFPGFAACGGRTSALTALVAAIASGLTLSTG